jgi:hypothetical protein
MNPNAVIAPVLIYTCLMISEKDDSSAAKKDQHPQ